MDPHDYKKSEIQNAVLAGIVVLIIFIPGIIKTMKQPHNEDSRDTQNYIEKAQYDELVESVSQQSTSKTPKYHYTIDVTTDLEDQEYLEVEQINGKYYVVNTDGYDDSYYEFDSDELLEDAVDIYEYAKRNHIKPTKRN